MRKLLIPIIGAIILRVVFLVWLPDTSRTTGDSPVYFQLAENIIQGHGYSTDEKPPFSPSIERTPAYPLFIAGVWLITGKSKFALSVAQLLLDLLTLILVYEITRIRFGGLAAAIAAILYAILPFTAGMSCQYMSEGLAMACVALALYAQTRGVYASASRNRWHLLSGIAWGVGTLARPYLAPLIAAAAGVLWFESLQLPARRRVIACVILGLGWGAAVVPWTIRNTIVAVKKDVPFVIFQTYGSRPPFTRMYTPGFLRWMSSYEEPMLWAIWNKPPQAKYLTEREEQEVKNLWVQIVKNDGEVTPDMDSAFDRITKERYNRAPFRLYIWRPVSIALRMWLSPRISIFEFHIEEHPFLKRAPWALTGIFMALNLILVLLAAWGILRQGIVRGLFLWAFLAVLTVTIIYLGAPRESRYVMPLFPLLVIAASVGIIELIQDRVKSR